MDTYPSHPTTAILPIDTPKIGELKAERNEERRRQKPQKRKKSTGLIRAAWGAGHKGKNQKHIKSGYARRAIEMKPWRGAPAPQGKKPKKK